MEDVCPPSTELTRFRQVPGGFCPVATPVTEQTPCCWNSHFGVCGMCGGKETHRGVTLDGDGAGVPGAERPPTLYEAKPMWASGQNLIHCNSGCVFVTHLVGFFSCPVPSKQEIAMPFWKRSNATALALLSEDIGVWFSTLKTLVFHKRTWMPALDFQVINPISYATL